MPTVGIKKVRYEDSQQTLTDTVNKNFQILEWVLSGKLNGTNLNEDYLENFIANHVQAGDILVTKGTNARVVLNESQIAMQVSPDGGTTWVNKVYFDSITGQYIFDGVLSADVVNAITALITPSIAADVANISDLTVSHLSTGQKALRYLGMDYSNLNYIKIYNQNIDFILASNARSREQATTIDGALAYWVDETHNAITKSVTPYPVYQFVYDELTKLSLNFTEGDVDGVPTISLGAGYGDGSRRGRGFIYKSDGGLYIEYVTYSGNSKIIKLTESGIDLSDFEAIKWSEQVVMLGVPRIWAQDDPPAMAQNGDVWVDTNDYSRYDVTALISSGITLLESSNEVVVVEGSYTVSLHTATTPGIVKKIYNKGTGVVTVAGTINGSTNMYLFPGESVELITDGSSWRIS